MLMRFSQPTVSEMMNRFMNDFDSDMPAAKNCKPAVNIRENENEFELDIMVPGMKKEDFKINVENDILTVSAEVTTKDEVKDKEYVRKEFYFGSFNRRFSMPDSVNADKIEANYTNGILVVSLPKKEEAKPQPVRMIEIA